MVRRRRSHHLLAVLLFAACDRGSASSPPSPRDPCGADALGIPTAKALNQWQPPPTCTVHLAQGETAVVRSAEDVAKVFDCPATVLGVDFANTTLVVAPRFLSEAMSSYLAYDDGKTVTLVARQLTPCPGGEHPMMGNDLYIYAVGSGDRAIAERSCTVDRKCR